MLRIAASLGLRLGLGLSPNSTTIQSEKNSTRSGLEVRKKPKKKEITCCQAQKKIRLYSLFLFKYDFEYTTTTTTTTMVTNSFAFGKNRKQAHRGRRDSSCPFWWSSCVWPKKLKTIKNRLCHLTGSWSFGTPATSNLTLLLLTYPSLLSVSLHIYVVVVVCAIWCDQGQGAHYLMPNSGA